MMLVSLILYTTIGQSKSSDLYRLIDSGPGGLTVNGEGRCGAGPSQMSGKRGGVVSPSCGEREMLASAGLPSGKAVAAGWSVRASAVDTYC